MAERFDQSSGLQRLCLREISLREGSRSEDGEYAKESLGRNSDRFRARPSRSLCLGDPHQCRELSIGKLEMIADEANLRWDETGGLLRKSLGKKLMKLSHGDDLYTLCTAGLAAVLGDTLEDNVVH